MLFKTSLIFLSNNFYDSLSLVVVPTMSLNEKLTEVQLLRLRTYASKNYATLEMNRKADKGRRTGARRWGGGEGCALKGEAFI